MTIKTTVTSGEEAQAKLLKGAKTVASAVASTLGPSGRQVAIAYANEHGIYGRIIVSDGVTVARSINLVDEDENFGAQIIIETARKQVLNCGDGTSVSVILGYAIFLEIHKLVVAGYDPMLLKKGLEASIEILIEEIKKVSIPVKTLKQKEQIANISAKDEDLGKLIAETIHDMGEDGLVVVEESTSPHTTVDKQSGFQFDKGWAAQEFMTNPDRGEATIEGAYILITDQFIDTLDPIKSLLQECANAKKKIVIIASQFSLVAAGFMVDNRNKSVLSSLLIEAPSFGNNQKNILNDIATFTNGKFFSQSTGLSLESATLADLGRAEYVKSTKNETLIVGGSGTGADIDMRVAEIKKSIETEDLEYDQDKMKERLARLTSGVAVIKVGGQTEVEMKERLERVKDAVAATKAAVRYGIVPGGEVIYLVVREKLDQKDIAQNILYKALYQPFKILLNNASMNDGEWYEKLKDSGKSTRRGASIFSTDTGLTAHDLARMDLNNPDQTILVKGDVDKAVKIIGAPMKNAGVNVVKQKIQDMVKEGIIDPAQVSMEALKNASSTAILKATTGFIIIQKDIDKK